VSFDEFLESMIAGKVPRGPYPDHVNGYLKFKKEHPDRIHILQYESLKKNTHHEVKCLAKFLGFGDIDDAIVAEICEKTSFEAMKANNDVNWSDKKKLGHYDKSVEFFRKGEIGDWKTHFASDEQIKRFDAAITEQLIE